jgi:transmembrane protein
MTMATVMKPAIHDDTPALIVRILEARVTVYLARLCLTLPFWWSGVDKLLHPHAALAEIQGLGLPSSWLLYGLLLITQLGGSLAIIFNRYAWLGAGALGVFTGIVTYMAHAFWTLQGPARFAEMNDFLEHISLMAGMVFGALHCHEVKVRDR